MAARLLVRVDRHLVEARDDDVEPLASAPSGRGRPSRRSCGRRRRCGTRSRACWRRRRGRCRSRARAAAPLSASCTARMPQPQPTSRHVPSCPAPVANRCFQHEVAALRRDEDAGVDGELGKRQREERRAPGRRATARTAAGPGSPPRRGRRPRSAPAARRASPRAPRGGGDVLRRHAAAAADDLRALVPPLERERARTPRARSRSSKRHCPRRRGARGSGTRRAAGSVKSRSHEIIPGTWSTGRQLISSAPTPISSKRRAARPKRSPSGGPQCWP